MVTGALAKKRKRDREEEEDNGRVTLSLSTQDVSQLGPVLASFPALHPSKSTSFKCYARPSSTSAASDQEFASQPLILAGETKSVEFYSTNEAETVPTGTRYLIGVHNKKTNTVTLRPVPMQILTRRVKALKGIEATPVSALQKLEARNDLGETFGTKKAVKAIRAAERNKVDVSAMQGVTGYLQESIEASTSALPSKEEAKVTTDSNRLIPPHNPQAETAAGVYALHDIIPEVEFNAIPITELMDAGSAENLISQLPYKRCSWVNEHLSLLFATPAPNTSDLKIIFYVSAMMAFRQASFSLDDQQKFQKRMTPTPTVIVDGLVSRFTETARGSSTPRSTTRTQTMLLTYMFALCLRVDDFATDASILANDLAMSLDSTRLLFKSLGCKIETLKLSDLKRLGLPDTASKTKRAVLRIPFEFPKPKAKRRN